MTTKHTGGHAFPTQSWEYDVGKRVPQYQEPGMSLRDYEISYRMANAMLKAREASNG